MGPLLGAVHGGVGVAAEHGERTEGGEVPVDVAEEVDVEGDCGEDYGETPAVAECVAESGGFAA